MSTPSGGAPPCQESLLPMPLAAAARSSSNGSIQKSMLAATRSTRLAGDWLTVTADIFADGHDQLAAALLLRPEGAERWTEVRMTSGSGDRWTGRVRLPAVGRYRYTIEAWRDDVASWSDRLHRKAAARRSIEIEVAETAVLLRASARRAKAAGASEDAVRIKDVRRAIAAATGPSEIVRLAGGVRFLAAAARHPDRSAASRYARELEVVVERRAAAFGAWYELFPRSQGTTPGVGATLTRRRGACRRWQPWALTSSTCHPSIPSV
jgi:starch synthase (maltosyl-transferring)